LNSVAKGEVIVFCEAAEFFDEQPYQVKVMLRQRMRWIKGRLYSFLTTFYKLLLGIFTRKGIGKFTCFDMFMYSFPNTIYYSIRGIVIPFFKKIISLIVILYVGNGAGVGAGTGNGKAIRGALIVIREHKRIHCPPLKLAFYTLLSPWFDMIGAPLAIMALFSTTKWKPIKHDEVISIDQLTEK
jgi:cellulose synthase/poly-beta-1,6-N-acetylglucosamine synthase-like glycosyltransferase